MSRRSFIEAIRRIEDSDVVELLGVKLVAGYTGTGPLSTSTVGSVVPCDDVVKRADGFVPTPDFMEFTVEASGAGEYLFFYGVSGRQTGGSNRTIFFGEIEVVPFEGSPEADPLSYGQEYSRNNNQGHFSVDGMSFVSLSEGDVVRFEQGRITGPGTGPFEGRGTYLIALRVG